MTTHFGFEWGVMTSIVGQSLNDSSLRQEHLDALKKEGFITLYKQAVRRVDEMSMYKEFIDRGWTRNLAAETKNILIPLIIEMVTLVWIAAYEGYIEA